MIAQNDRTKMIAAGAKTNENKMIAEMIAAALKIDRNEMIAK